MDVMKIARAAVAEVALSAMVTVSAAGMANAQGGSIYEATLAEPGQKTQEVS